MFFSFFGYVPINTIYRFPLFAKLFTKKTKPSPFFAQAILIISPVIIHPSFFNESGINIPNKNYNIGRLRRLQKLGNTRMRCAERVAYRTGVAAVCVGPSQSFGVSPSRCWGRTGNVHDNTAVCLALILAFAYFRSLFVLRNALCQKLIIILG